MRSVRLFPQAVLVCFISWAGPTHAQSAPESQILFKDFLTGVASADARQVVGSGEAKVEGNDAFEQMRRHVLSLYEGVEPTHSFLLDFQYFDCVPILQQPSVRRLGLKQIAAPPPPVHRAGQRPSPYAPSPLELGLLDQFGNRIECAKGTIPMRRISLEELSRFKTLQDYFQKGPDGAGRAPLASPPPSFNGHTYAQAQQVVDNLGGWTLLNVWSPWVNFSVNQIFSLSQVWYTDGGLQTVEGGWQVYPLKYHRYRPVLFIFWTPDYYQTGCYNLDCAGFTQTSSDVPLGSGPWGAGSVSGGQQVTFSLQWQFYQGNWWMTYNDTHVVGYYAGTLFNGGQMSRYSRAAMFGGETVSTGTTWPPMGSGAWPSAGLGYAAYQGYTGYFDLNGRFFNANLTTRLLSPCYGLEFFVGDTTSFFFGGPGGSGC